MNNDPVNYVDLWGLLASEGHINWNAVLDGVQAGLDVAGLVPGVGEIADGVNALISLGRGDVAGATLSAMSMVPVVGDAIGKGGKILRAGFEHGDEVLEAGTKLLGDINDSTKIIQSKVKSNHGNSLSTTKPAQGYILRNRDTQEILKYGETTRGNRRYTKKYLNETNSFMDFQVEGTKREMHDWQHEKILEYKAEHGGQRPPLNKSDW